MLGSSSFPLSSSGHCILSLLNTLMMAVSKWLHELEQLPASTPFQTWGCQLRQNYICAVKLLTLELFIPNPAMDTEPSWFDDIKRDLPMLWVSLKCSQVSGRWTTWSASLLLNLSSSLLDWWLWRLMPCLSSGIPGMCLTHTLEWVPLKCQGLWYTV